MTHNDRMNRMYGVVVGILNGIGLASYIPYDYEPLTFMLPAATVAFLFCGAWYSDRREP